MFICTPIQDQINTAVKLGKETTMKYPNVTVCFAKFFDTQLLEGIFYNLMILNNKNRKIKHKNVQKLLILMFISLKKIEIVC